MCYTDSGGKFVSDYFQKRNKKSIEKLRQLESELPCFCSEFFMGIEQTTSLLTRMNYAYDLRVFFDFLVNEIEEFRDFGSPRNVRLNDLDRLSSTHLEYYLSYLSSYTFQGRECANQEKAKARKLSSVRSMLRYFYKKGSLKENVSAKVNMPKLHEKEIIRLEGPEISDILDLAEGRGDRLSGRQKSFHARTRLRDSAILTLFLGTGIRISELVGLNNEDIDFHNNSFVVTRKGGNKTILYFSEEVADALYKYLEEKRAKAETMQDNALFLSLRNTRIGVRAVELLVKKYAGIASPLKKITPHKLRSTYGTRLYQETHDIYVVADVLGHKDVNTTKKHYAAISDDIRKNAATKVALRQNSAKSSENGDAQP